MIDYKKILEEALEDLRKLTTVPGIWKSKLVDYESPLVERVWTEYRDCRLSLHRIHPCKQPLKHVHPWPSIVRVLSGSYNMEVGRVNSNGAGGWNYDLLGTFLMTAGSEYNLVAEDAWHTVNPIYSPSISLMLMGKPWEPHPSMKDQPKPGELKPLHEESVLDILKEVRYVLHS